MENNLENLTIWRFCQGGRGQRGDNPLYEVQGPVAGIRTSLRQHPPLWGGGRFGSRTVGKSAQRLGSVWTRLLSCCGSTMAPTARRPAAWPNTLKDVREKMADLARMETVLV